MARRREKKKKNGSLLIFLSNIYIYYCSKLRDEKYFYLHKCINKYKISDLAVLLDRFECKL